MVNKQLESFFNTADSELVFCLLDIDDFKIYNIIYGFESGDDLLKKIANEINQLPTICSVIRLGNDEFLFSCFGNFELNKRYSISLMQTIETVEKVTVSIGVMEHNVDRNFLKYMLSKLKLNVLTAKNNGKNKICFE